jgi:hypothetical protein
MLRGVFRETWPGRFSSALRLRRIPLPLAVAEEMARVFDRTRAKAEPGMLARSYVDALPYPPNRPDEARTETLAALRAEAGGRNRFKRPSCSRGVAVASGLRSTLRRCQ